MSEDTECACQPRAPLRRPTSPRPHRRQRRTKRTKRALRTLIGVGLSDIFCSNASLRLCAGSVDISSTKGTRKCEKKRSRQRKGSRHHAFCCFASDAAARDPLQQQQTLRRQQHGPFSFGRAAAICTDSDHDVVVLPTPPLPPTKIHLILRSLRKCDKSGASEAI